MSLMARGMTMLRSRLGTAAGVTVVLRRVNDDGTFTATTITDAVVGRTVFKRNDFGAAAIEFGERDYLIPVASYTITGLGAVTPAEGDRLSEVVNGATLTFEIMRIPGEPAWRYSSPDRLLYRIHVKRVTDETGR